MIATLLWWGNVAPLPQLAVILAWGAVAGSALQMLVQLPAVLKLVPHLRLRLELSEHVRTTVRNFVPVFVSRGVVQISAYIDEVLASLLPTGAVTGLANAQAALHAAGQPVRAVRIGRGAAGNVRRRRPRRDARPARPRQHRPASNCVLRRAVGSRVSHARRCRRSRALSDRPFHIRRCGVSCGGFSRDRRSVLLATTLARLYSSTYYALRDTRTPLRYALVHVGIATVLGYVAAIVLPPMLGIEPLWGTVGSDGRRERRRVGRADAAAPIAQSAHRPDRVCPFSLGLRLWSAAFAAAAVAWGIKLALPACTPDCCERC